MNTIDPVASLSAAFKKWQSSLPDGSSCQHDERTGLGVLHVKSLSAFIQAIGYLKFLYRKEGATIYYRGQTELYDSGVDAKGSYRFCPSGLRKIKREIAAQEFRKEVKSKVECLRDTHPMFKDKKDFPDSVLEGLLQQYGLDTTWFDVVDNIWVALWFACFKSIYPVTTKLTDDKTCVRSYIHMIRREAHKEQDRERYAYILLLGADKNAEVVDLRCSLPSVFIRPHVQHGLLVRLKDKNAVNMVSLIKGIIRIDLLDALAWLGEGRTLLPESIMPPPNYDSGFRQLLEGESKNTSEPLVRFPIFC